MLENTKDVRGILFEFKIGCVPPKTRNQKSTFGRGHQMTPVWQRYWAQRPHCQKRTKEYSCCSLPADVNWPATEPPSDHPFWSPPPSIPSPKPPQPPIPHLNWTCSLNTWLQNKVYNQTSKTYGPKPNQTEKSLRAAHFIFCPCRRRSDESGESGRDVSFDEEMQGLH